MTIRRLGVWEKAQEPPPRKGPERKREDTRGAPPGARLIIRWQCGQPGHKKGDCSYMECGFAEFCGWTNAGGKGQRLSTVLVMVGRKPQRALIDTASAWFLIQRWLVKPHWMIPGAKMNLECVLGDKRQWPIAEGPLKVQGRFQWKWVGVAEGLPFPVVLAMDWDPFPGGKGGSGRKPPWGKGEASR